MNLDLVETFPCSRVQAGPGCGPRVPVPVGGGGDLPCCQQPDYAGSMPTICDPGSFGPKLILKPGYLLKKKLQQASFALTLLKDGAETDVSGTAVFATSNPAVAVVGQSSGKVSTVGPGTCTISATYGGSTAFATVEVLDTCAGSVTDFVIVLDASLSMGLPFSSLYATKLAFAKQQASDFVDGIDLTKDAVAVYSFGNAAQLEIGLSQDANAIKAAIAGVAVTLDKTNLVAGLTGALNAFASDGSVHGIVLFSDGENKSGGNPLTALAGFTGSARNVLMVCGVRAYGAGFTLLDNLATGGYFINALESNQGSVKDWLAGLKGYVLSGNCGPATPDLCVPYAQLDYDKFAQWDVIGGHVDLIGDGGRPLFDLLPGNGLYVDMAGSGAPYAGHLRSKASFAFKANDSYQVRLRIAGNQRGQEGTYTIGIKVEGVFEQHWTISDPTQPFTDYAWNFEPGSDVTGQLEILLESQPAGGNPSFGLLIDDVHLDHVVGLTNTPLLSDDFNGENVTCFKTPPCAGGSDCFPASNDDCPGGCGPAGLLPSSVAIVGYTDDLFDPSGCPQTGTHVCFNHNPAWDGTFPLNVQSTGLAQDDCGYGFELAGTVQTPAGTHLTLANGKSIANATCSGGEDIGWNLIVSVSTCLDGEADLEGGNTGQFSVWEGHKCGNSPDGVYVKTGGCSAGPATVTVVAGGTVRQCLEQGKGCLDAGALPPMTPDGAPLNDVEPCPQSGVAGPPPTVVVFNGVGLGDDTGALGDDRGVLV